MSVQERRRLAVLSQVAGGQLSVAEAGRQLGLSERQIRRVWGRYRREGDAGLVHGLRGRPGNRGIDPALRGQALALYREHYADFGPTLASEMLAERDGLVVHPQTLRRWLVDAGLWRSRRRRPPKRQRRPRRAHFGELVQLDGSPHDWFEQGVTGGALPCLMVMVDDATGETDAQFFPAESTVAAMTMVGDWARRHGLPQAVYSDRHSIYRRNDREADEVADRTGQRPPTQFGRALAELGVGLIWARSPQAKGRVERRHRVFQDRLVKALRLAEIGDPASANVYLREVFLPQLNARLRVAATGDANLHVAAEEADLDAALVYRESRQVGADQCVSFEGEALQLRPGRQLPSLAGKRVQVERKLDGTLRVRWRDQTVAWAKAARPEPRRSKPTAAERVAGHQPPWKPPYDHPWRSPAAAQRSVGGCSAPARAAPSPPLRTPQPTA